MDIFKRIRRFLPAMGILLVFISWQSDKYNKNLLILKDSDTTFREIRTVDDWNKRREQILDSIWLVMGRSIHLNWQREDMLHWHRTIRTLAIIVMILIQMDTQVRA
jgi:hypothetical protein